MHPFISHDAPFRTKMYAFLLWMVHCGICDRYIEGFVSLFFGDIALLLSHQHHFKSFFNDTFTLKWPMLKFTKENIANDKFITWDWRWQFWITATCPKGKWVNSLAPGRGSKFERVISEHMSQIKFMSSLFGIDSRWMPQNTSDDTSTLVQVMAWCRQATSHYLSQCWPRSMLPYGITRPQMS